RYQLAVPVLRGWVPFPGLWRFVICFERMMEIRLMLDLRELLLEGVLRGILPCVIQRRVDREPAIIDLVLRQQLIQMTLDCVHCIILLYLWHSLGVRHDFYLFPLFC